MPLTLVRADNTYVIVAVTNLTLCESSVAVQHEDDAVMGARHPFYKSMIDSVIPSSISMIILARVNPIIRKCVCSLFILRALIRLDTMMRHCVFLQQMTIVQWRDLLSIALASGNFNEVFGLVQLHKELQMLVLFLNHCGCWCCF